MGDKLKPIDGKWFGQVTQDVQDETYKFSTENTYVDKNIEFQVKIPTVDIENSLNVISAQAILSNENNSGVILTINNLITAPNSGWIDKGQKGEQLKKSINGVSIPKPSTSTNNTFSINDGINTWTWTVDAAGNVSIV